MQHSMRCGLRTLCVALTLSLTAITPVLGANRYALIIANSLYQHAPRLDGPEKDAELLRNALSAKALGFTVTVQRDRTLDQMLMDVTQFSASLQPGDIGVIYFSTHGIRADGRNYLMPIEANPRSVEELRISA